jgi:membrane protease YdiL (CAAX protease family)
MAMLAAPVCCGLFGYFSGHRTENLFWLLRDYESFLVLIFLYPVVEELAFRGVIQEYFAVRTNEKTFGFGITYANLITSILFALIHFVHHAPVWAVAVFIPSLIFGYFRDRFVRVLPAIFLHGFYNGVYFSYVGPPEPF